MVGKYIVYAFVTGLIAYEFRVYLNTSEPSGIVRTLNGKLQGTMDSSRAGRKFSSFYGVPYALPPVGNLRFALPQPVESWTGVKTADQYGIECIQRDFILDLGIIGQEDCLILNVHTPYNLKEPAKGNVSKDLYPVIVYIHGGGFLSGSSKSFHPHYFMDKDVVLVTINYRLGALGFLSTGDSAVRGNLGMHDQNLALKWINKNIQYFGGDPQQVTLMGESAGAVSVHLHTLSPMSAGLFQKAIKLSGHALVPWAVVEDPVKTAQRFGETVNCPYMCPSEFLKCLRQLPVEEIVEVHGVHRHAVVHPLENFGPVVEPNEDDNTFLAKKPTDILKSKNFTQVPTFIGANDGEGILWVARVILDLPETERIRKISGWYKALPNFLTLENLSAENAKKITKFYFGSDDKDFDPLSPELYLKFVNLFSDRVFYDGLIKLARLHQRSISKGSAPMYLYYYSYQSAYSLVKLATSVPTDRWFPSPVYMVFTLIKDYLKYTLRLGERPKTLPASHADELSLLFSLGPILNVHPTSKDYPMSLELIESMVRFAKDGTDMRFHGKDWPSVGSETPPRLMRLDSPDKAQMIDLPFKDRLDFWNSLNL